MTEPAYDARGFRLAVGASGGLHSIHCFNQTSRGPSVRDFQGTTREGIKLGATPNDVVKLHGEPDAKMGPTYYRYAKRGWQFSFRDGKLVSYQLNQSSQRGSEDRSSPRWHIGDEHCQVILTLYVNDFVRASRFLKIS
jgi:hypothetical protein